ncbi:MAG: queuosine salvage family protein [Solirubrobacteraceae bacterium]
MDELRDACAQIASEARWVQIATEAIAAYSGSLPLQRVTAPGPLLTGSDREHAAADTMALDAINFGSGWFPSLRKRAGRSGYGTVAEAMAEHRRRAGPWAASTLAAVSAPTIAVILGQEAGHPLMALYAASLRDLGRHVTADHEGCFAALVDAAGGSAVSLARRLGTWDCFADRACHRGLELPFLKRAQIAAADLQRAKVADWQDLSTLTMFADNLVPHVLRLDGILRFDARLVARIDREQLILHGSPEEVEIRACAVHAVELIVAARPGSRAADVDQLLWQRGGEARYKASPRHRCRCTAY